MQDARMITIFTELFCWPLAASPALDPSTSLIGFADMATGMGILGLVTDGGRMGMV